MADASARDIGCADAGTGSVMGGGGGAVSASASASAPRARGGVRRGDVGPPAPSPLSFLRRYTRRDVLFIGLLVILPSVLWFSRLSYVSYELAAARLLLGQHHVAIDFDLVEQCEQRRVADLQECWTQSDALLSMLSERVTYCCSQLPVADASLMREDVMQAFLRRNQHEATLDCDAAEHGLLVHHLNNWGIASDTFSMAYFFSLAVATNRSYVPVSPDFRYAVASPPNTCATKGPYCFFRRMSRCSLDDVGVREGFGGDAAVAAAIDGGGALDQYDVSWWVSEVASAHRRVLHVGWDAWANPATGIRLSFPHTELLLDIEERALHSRGDVSQQWICSQLIRYMLSPNESMQRYVQSVKDAIGWRRIMVGIVVVSNDELERSHLDSHDVHDYIRIATGHVNAAAGGAGVAAVYISGDISTAEIERLRVQYADVVPILRRYAAPDGVFVGGVADSAGDAATGSGGDGAGDRFTDDGVRYLADLYLMRDTAVLISCMSAELPRISAALALAERKMQQVVALDGSAWGGCVY